jgi:hypothetical protein
MLVRNRETNRPFRRKTLLWLLAAVLVVMSSQAARSEAPQQLPPPANPAPSHQESVPLPAPPDASTPGRSQVAAEAEWRLRILQILMVPYATERVAPFPR